MPHGLSWLLRPQRHWCWRQRHPRPAQSEPGTVLQTDTFDVEGTSGPGPFPAGALGNRFGGLLPVEADVTRGQFAGWVYLTIGTGPDADRVRVSCIEEGAELPSASNIPMRADGWDDLVSASRADLPEIAWLASHPTYQNTRPHTLDPRRVGTLLPATFGSTMDSLRADDDRLGTSANLRAYEAASLQVALWSLAGFEEGNISRYSYPDPLDTTLGAPLRARMSSLKRIAEASSGLPERPHSFVVDWLEGSEEGVYGVRIGATTSSGTSPLEGVSVTFTTSDGSSSTVDTSADGLVSVGPLEGGTTVTASAVVEVAAGTVFTPSGDYQQMISLDPADFQISSSFDVPEDEDEPTEVVPDDRDPESTTTTTEPPPTTTTTEPDPTDGILADEVPDELPRTGPSGLVYWIIGIAAAILAGGVYMMRLQSSRARSADSA